MWVPDRDPDLDVEALLRALRRLLGRMLLWLQLVLWLLRLGGAAEPAAAPDPVRPDPTAASDASTARPMG